MELLRQEWQVAPCPISEKQGVVVVIYHYNNDPSSWTWKDAIKLHHCNHRLHKQQQQQQHRMANVLPLRIDATHFCYHSPLLRPLIAGIQLFLDPYSRFRLLPHCGSIASVNHALQQTYSIPLVECSPMMASVVEDGSSYSWSVEQHSKWMAACRRRDEKLTRLVHSSSTTTVATIESATTTSTIASNTMCLARPSSNRISDDDPSLFIPGRFDVLFGKDRTARQHTGNLRALHLCDMYWDEYEAAEKYAKTDIAERIVSIIHESSGRFWRQDVNTGQWEEATDKEARQKIAHFFRQMRSGRKKQQTVSMKQS